MAGDPDYSNVVLLAGFEGTNGATTYSEEKNSRAVTFTSGARISTAQFKFGSSSFDYNGGSCSLADNIDWKLSGANSDQFCIEMWLRSTTATPGARAIIGQDFGAGDHAFYLATTAANELEFQADAAQISYAQWAVSSGLTWVANQWYHVAVSKDATGKVRLFRDGVMIGSSTPSDSRIANSTAVLNFGNRVPLTPWSGFMDETRITKGVARYSSDAGFTPPTAAFPRVDYTPDPVVLAGGVGSTSRGRMIRKRKKNELDDLDLDDLEVVNPSQFRIGRQSY